jgi:hypothetical protein
VTPDAVRAVIVAGPELVTITAMAQLAVAHLYARALTDWTWPRD